MCVRIPQERGPEEATIHNRYLRSRYERRSGGHCLAGLALELGIARRTKEGLPRAVPHPIVQGLVHSQRVTPYKTR